MKLEAGVGIGPRNDCAENCPNLAKTIEQRKRLSLLHLRLRLPNKDSEVNVHRSNLGQQSRAVVNTFGVRFGVRFRFRHAAPTRGRNRSPWDGSRRRPFCRPDWARRRALPDADGLVGDIAERVARPISACGEIRGGRRAAGGHHTARTNR